MQRNIDEEREYQRYLAHRHVGAQTRRSAERNAAFFLPHLQAGMGLLDAGCGPGSITLGLAERVVPGEVVGIDISMERIEQARGLADERGVTNVWYERGDVYDLPFEDASFDAAFMHTVLQHLSDPLA